MDNSSESFPDESTKDPPELREEAEKLSQKWEEILEDFFLPCPICSGEMEMQGVAPSRLYEFAEGEPGTVTPIDLTPIEFVCSRCGYTAEFDSQLFNPSYLAKLSGAKPERVAHLSKRDFRVLVPLRGDERSSTLLDLATSIAKSRDGEILILEAGSDSGQQELLGEKLQEYKPPAGSPAPVSFIHRTPDPLKTNLAEAVTRNRCDMLLIEARGWGRSSQVDVAPLIEEILKEDLCDVAIVHDRGLRQVNRVLLATSGGPNAQAAAPFVLDIARAFDAELHLLYIASSDDPASQEAGQNRIAETLGKQDVEAVKLQRRILVHSDPVQALVSESGEYDILVLGGSPRDWRAKLLLNSFSAKVARNSDATTIVLITPGDQPLSFISRLLGI